MQNLDPKPISLAVVILTYNEEIHIERCLASVQPVARKILVVDSFSTDRTVEIAEAQGARVVQRAFKNYADQFQWALDNLEIDTDWILRLDADEYLEPDLVSELLRELPGLQPDIHGMYLRLKVVFMGRWMRFGSTYPLVLLRIWRAGKGRIEQRWMDEHIVLAPGASTASFSGHLVNENLKGITFWTAKHNAYASREMADILIWKYALLNADPSLQSMSRDPQARSKRWFKEKVYNRLPPVQRATVYFLYRYLVRLGFLDGAEGFIWNFLQGYWYRLLVDVKLMEVEAMAHGDPEAVKRCLEREHGIIL